MVFLAEAGSFLWTKYHVIPCNQLTSSKYKGLPHSKSARGKLKIVQSAKNWVSSLTLELSSCRSCRILMLSFLVLIFLLGQVSVR